ncbi:MAG: iron complex outermembrane receptor protein [Psychromonas sp.]|jgi:iron complex outermembrane receptor protein|uniref:TonB-dependent receptor plug domain-containing protein n=1 Tax=Psychromonas sp. TaxID=1884585 RepID=UPI0039E597EC
MTKLLSYHRYIFAFFFLFNQINMVSSAWADSASPSYDLDTLPSLDFDQLLAADVQVTSAMKRLQNMSETAASIYVLTDTEIMRSGVTSVAQALKLVPGMQVRQLDNNQWAITSRSTAGRYSSKLLVMIDGQSIYNPGFAGVYWEALNIPLYDIERIEVIRGQGGLLWGSNATNGVVNIISKHTADTRSVLAQVENGSQIDSKVNFRVGGDLANYSSFRIFGGFEDTDQSTKSSRSVLANDDGEKQSIGGRVDLNLNDNLSLLAQTQYTHIEMGQNLELADLNTYATEYIEDQYTRDHLQIMSRLEHRLSSVSNQMLQISMSSQKGEQRYYKDDFFITDIDYQMNTLLNDIQFDWGVNYRYNAISIEDTDYISSIDDIDSYNHFGGFLQAQFNITPDKLKLILGNRSEKNSFTGWEHQPMGRLLWTPNSSHTFWGAVSQGVRIPSWIESNSRVIGTSQFAIPTVITGSADIDAEKSISKELGYRYTENLWSMDLSLFHTKATDVIAIDPSIDYVNSLVRLDFVSDAKLTTYGGEAIIKWQPYERLTTELGYSFTSYKYDLPSGTQSAIGYDSYLRQIIAKTNFSLTANHSIFAVYRIEEGDAYGTDDYSVLDLSWNWQVTPSATLSLTGNNLLYGKHLQYNNSNETYTLSTYIEPSYVARITAEF